MEREKVLADTLVTLADTLVDAYDPMDFMQTLAERCVELLDVSEAGIMLADSQGKLHHVACSSEQTRLVGLFELHVEEGPCFDAFTNRVAVGCDSLHEADVRWPRFAPHAHEAGFDAASAVPMRLRSEAIGALYLFSIQSGALTQGDLATAQAMADIATIGILQQRALHDAQALAAQFETALGSRIVIEQAKGIVAAHNHVDVDAAFQQIRRFARDHNRLLSETARKIIDGELPPITLSRSKRS